MGTVNITQLYSIADDSNGTKIPVAQMPAHTSTNVTSGATTVQSTAFAVNTNYVRIATDTTVRIAFGSNPVATAASTRLLANTAEYFGVIPTHKVAVINE